MCLFFSQLHKDLKYEGYMYFYMEILKYGLNLNTETDWISYFQVVLCDLFPIMWLLPFCTHEYSYPIPPPFHIWGAQGVLLSAKTQCSFVPNTHIFCVH